MTLIEWLGVAALIAAMLLAAVLLGGMRLERRLKLLLLAALALRVVGAGMYFSVATRVYGRGDYLMYLERGGSYADRLRHLDFSMFVDQGEWFAGTWWGTQFVAFPVGIIGALLGPSVIAQFIVFGLISFAGLLCFGVAFHRTHPDVPVRRYLRWILFFPALWFWPSAPGKEALILLGAGLVVLGYCSHRERVSWPTLAAGLLLVFAVRPQVAMVFLAALVVAQWAGADRGWTPGRVAQGVAIVVVAVVGITFAMRKLGIADSSPSGVGTYLAEQGARRSSGSDVQAATVGLRGVPRAIVNVWFRPFPWEGRSAMASLAALEMVALWGVVLAYRRRFARALLRWRGDRMLRLALPFLAFYSVSAGMVMWNLGIIDRQRILLFPFLFLLFEVVPRQRRAAMHWQYVREPAPATARPRGRPIGATTVAR